MGYFDVSSMESCPGIAMCVHEFDSRRLFYSGNVVKDTSRLL